MAGKELGTGKSAKGKIEVETEVGEAPMVEAVSVAMAEEPSVVPHSAIDPKALAVVEETLPLPSSLDGLDMLQPAEVVPTINGSGLLSPPGQLSFSERLSAELSDEILASANEQVLARIKTRDQVLTMVRNTQRMVSAITTLAHRLEVKLPSLKLGDDTWELVQPTDDVNRYSYRQIEMMVAYLDSTYKVLGSKVSQYQEIADVFEAQMKQAEARADKIANEAKANETRVRDEYRSVARKWQELAQTNYRQFFADGDLPYVIMHTSKRNRFLGTTYEGSGKIPLATFKRVIGFDRALKFDTLAEAQACLDRMWRYKAKLELKNLKAYQVGRMILIVPQDSKKLRELHAEASKGSAD